MPPAVSPSRQPRSSHEFAALLELYKEQCAHGRHIESQRSAVASMFLTATGILLSVIGALKFALGSLPLAACVIVLAHFAKKFIRTYEAKWDETGDRRSHYRDQMEEVSGAQRCTVPRSGGTLRRHWERTFDIVLAIGLVVALVIGAKAFAIYSSCQSPKADAVRALALIADCPTANVD